MLIQKIQAVKKILNEAEKQTSVFAKRNHISCVAGCGRCCITPHVEASPLEFLPAAYELYKQGKIEEFYEKVSAKKPGEYCLFFIPPGSDGENCTFYPYRGLICRVFGYSARITKTKNHEMITCQIIKQSAQYGGLDETKLKTAPIAADFYMQLRNIDIGEAENMMPLNAALKKAMEEVMFYFSYNQERP
jgi:uncharacterized protein